MSAATKQARVRPVRLARHPRRPPDSLTEALAPIDKRTRLGKDVAAFRAELVAHVGGKPSAPQAALIEVALQLRMRLAAMDVRFAECGEMSAHDSRTYLALTNSHARLMRQLDRNESPRHRGDACPSGRATPAQASLAQDLSRALARRQATAASARAHAAAPVPPEGR